jgi:hypothetical protein
LLLLLLLLLPVHTLLRDDVPEFHIYGSSNERI